MGCDMETTLCHIIDKDKVLLKMASRGVSKGKWNALGGKIENGESPRENALRESYEESGLVLKDMKKIGVLSFYRGSKRNLFLKMHVFSATKFSGRITEGEEGKLRWFNVDEMPFDQMWDDDKYWWHLMRHNICFDGEFIFDSKMSKVQSYAIKRIRKASS